MHGSALVPDHNSAKHGSASKDEALGRLCGVVNRMVRFVRDPPCHRVCHNDQFPSFGNADFATAKDASDLDHRFVAGDARAPQVKLEAAQHGAQVRILEILARDAALETTQD
jgi:hypothetical protein